MSEYLNSVGRFNSNYNTTNVNEAFSVTNEEDNFFLNNSSNYSLSNVQVDSFNLSKEQIELIKKELARKIEEMKSDLSNKKETRGWMTSAWNGICGLFGGGDKKTQNNIAKFEELLSGLDSDISNIDEVYKTIMGVDLDISTLNTMEYSQNIASSLNSETQNAIIMKLENK